MANVHGKDAHFSFDDTSDSLSNISTKMDTSSLAQAIESADTSTYQDESRTFIAGLATANIPIGGPWDAALDAYFGTTAQQKVLRGWQFGPAGSDSGAIKYTGEALITGYTNDPPVGDRVSWSATLLVSGDITRGTFA